MVIAEYDVELEQLETRRTELRNLKRAEAKVAAKAERDERRKGRPEIVASNVAAVLQGKAFPAFPDLKELAVAAYASALANGGKDDPMLNDPVKGAARFQRLLSGQWRAFERSYLPDHGIMVYRTTAGIGVADRALAEARETKRQLSLQTSITNANLRAESANRILGTSIPKMEVRLLT